MRPQEQTFKDKVELIIQRELMMKKSAVSITIPPRVSPAFIDMLARELNSRYACKVAYGKLFITLIKVPYNTK